MAAQEPREACQWRPVWPKAGQNADMVHMLRAVAEQCPEYESCWQELVLAAHHIGWHEKAVEFAKQAVCHHPRSGWLWRFLGAELAEVDRLDEAGKAFDTAQDIVGDNDEWLLRYRAIMSGKQSFEKQIEVLETLNVLDRATASDLFDLGFAYHETRNFAKALEFFRLSVATDSGTPTEALYNMGLVFSDPEVSQDADAADAYRRALALTPDDILADIDLDTARRKLAPLAESARAAATGLVQSEDLFRFYVSPFEVLQIDAVESVENLDVKVIQRAKKQLLQEIDLNDGKVSWLEDYPLDKSRALVVDDELYDESKRHFHWAVFQNKPLLRFLTRGDIGHFLYSDDYFPRETLELLDEEPEFRAFLSKPFARQYNVILARAIEQRLLTVIEVLFDGRRWVEPEDEDVCFEGTLKRIVALVEQTEDMARQSTETKVTASHLEEFLSRESVPQILNLLPTAFRGEQSRLVAAIRQIAITCHNEHGDTEESATILKLCNRFKFRSTELNKWLEDDALAVQGILDEHRKHSFSAWLKRDMAVSVSHAGVRLGQAVISPVDLESMRWGVSIQTVNGIETGRFFSIVLRDNRSTVAIEWHKRGLVSVTKSLFRKHDEVVPITEMNGAEQEVMFQTLLDAVSHHLVSPLVSKLVKCLHAGRNLVIGPCTLSRSGIAFRTGLMFRKDHVLPWTDCGTQMQNGQVLVMSKANQKAQVTMATKDTDNAVLLPIICAAMNEQSD